MGRNNDILIALLVWAAIDLFFWILYLVIRLIIEAFRRPKVQIDGDVWRYILNENGYVDRVEEIAPGIYLYYDRMRLIAVTVFRYWEQPDWALARLPWSIRKVLEKSLRK